MEFIRFCCLACGKGLKAKQHFAGKFVKCSGRKCGQVQVVPGSLSDKPKKHLAAASSASMEWPNPKEELNFECETSPEREPVLWPWYVGGGTSILAIVTAIVLIFALQGKKRDSEVNESVSSTRTDPESPPKSESKVAPISDSRNKTKVEAKPESRADPKAGLKPKIEAKPKTKLDDWADVKESESTTRIVVCNAPGGLSVYGGTLASTIAEAKGGGVQAQHWVDAPGSLWIIAEGGASWQGVDLAEGRIYAIDKDGKPHLTVVGLHWRH
jgi:hypothetical protein